MRLDQEKAKKQKALIALDQIEKDYKNTVAEMIEKDLLRDREVYIFDEIFSIFHQIREAWEHIANIELEKPGNHGE